MKSQEMHHDLDYVGKNIGSQKTQHCEKFGFGLHWDHNIKIFYGHVCILRKHTCRFEQIVLFFPPEVE